jgi:dUTP pyrophosphatase
MSLFLKVKKLFHDARIPERANSTDSGADVFVYRFEKFFTVSSVSDEDRFASKDVSNLETIELCTNDRVLINTGLSVTVGPGYEIQVRPRSGNALKKGLIVVNSPGTIDEGYRGMLGIIIANIGHAPQEIKKGDKIAQIVVSKVNIPSILVVDELDQTKRGMRGFGSTDS